MSDEATYCSFCGKRGLEVKVLIAGPACFICNECVLLCVDILIDHTLPSNVRTIAQDKTSGKSPILQQNQ